MAIPYSNNCLRRAGVVVFPPAFFKELIYCFLSVDGYLVGKVVNEDIGINQIHSEPVPLGTYPLNFFF